MTHRTVVPSLIALAVGLGLFFLVIPFVWRELPKARVFLDGQPVAARVYVDRHDNLLIVMSGTGGVQPYVVYRADGRVMLPNASRFVYLGALALTKSWVSPGVDMDNPVKVEHRPRLDIKRDRVEFTSAEGERVRIMLGTD
jgi:hypothetical protein